MIDHKVDHMATDKGVAGLTVLIIDDDDEVMQTILSMHGVSVHVARDGLDALKMVTDVRPDVICLDLRLPVMDGFETLQSIRAVPEWVHIPVVAVTATPLLGVRESVEEAGFDGYLAKPYSVKALLNLIRECAIR